MPCRASLCCGDVVQLAGVEQRLAGDAADVQAGAAERLVGRFSTQATFMPELRRPDRRDVPARPGADHDEVELLGHVAPKKS